MLLACYTMGPVAEMIQLLLSAGADPNARNDTTELPQRPVSTAELPAWSA